MGDTSMSDTHTQDRKTHRSGPDWTNYVHYYCRACGAECINDYRRDCVSRQECLECHRVGDLEQLDVLLQGARLGPPTTRQAADLVCGQFQASERPEDGRKPGTAAGRARNVPRSGGSAVPSSDQHDLGLATFRLAALRED